MDKRNNDKNDINNPNSDKSGNPRKKQISENDLRMPTAARDGDDTNREDRPGSHPQPEGTEKLPQREEPAFSETNEGSFSNSGETGSTENSKKKTGNNKDNPSEETIKQKAENEPRAIRKEPSKIIQAAKGRFEDKEKGVKTEKNSPNKAESGNTKDSNQGIQNPKKVRSTKGTLDRENGPVSKPGNKNASSGKTIKMGEVNEDVPKKSPGSGNKAEGAKAKDKKPKSFPEPNSKVGRKKANGTGSSEKTSREEDNSTAGDLKDLATAAAMKFVEKFLPDEETRNEITKTARDILPDADDIKKTAEDLKNRFSPEVELVNKMVNKVIPGDSIAEKTEKIKKSAKKVSNRNQEKAAEKKFNEISLISEYDVHLFKEGKHFHLYKKLGSHPMSFNGVSGVYFALWAPNARNVSVVGDFNNWFKQANPMVARPDESGLWEVFIPEAKKGSIYKYFIQSTTGYEAEKGDPFALMWEVPPNTASVVWDLEASWNDSEWMKSRKEKAGTAMPVSVYELHIGSWKRVPEEGNRSLSYQEMAKELPAYINEMGFTHVEFMPVMEHPFFGSWGYQVTGYFAPSSRFGTPQDFMKLVDALHQAGIGVILDWVPSHFPSDLHGLHYFDGTFLFEHEDPQKGFHPDWQSYIFNYGRNEVRSFLISNALFWLDKFHVDGLRVDAVASMLYLDYSRNHGEWEPNEHGGNENLEAISFLKEFNEVVYGQFPDTITIAEESTAWPMVSKPTYMGGLGFGMKWMMGWMHDTLEYFKKDPIHRKHHQNTITFSTTYAFTENFMLPLSHDEVVYGKKALWNKMPGDDWNKFANLRTLYAYMFAHPGTKLLFMGAEFAQKTEWDHDSSLDWHITFEEPHKQIQQIISALNNLYKTEPALYEKSFGHDGFEWIDFNDADSSIMSFLRKGNDRKDDILVIFNFTPVPRENYRIGVPAEGNWMEIFNSDDHQFGGSGVNNNGGLKSEGLPTHHKNYSISLSLPPMGVIYLKLE